MSSGRALAARQGAGPPAVASRSGGGSSKQQRSAASSTAATQQAAAAGIQVIQNPLHFGNNVGVVYFLRIYMTIVAGAAVGILGVSGLPGFGGYLISQALCTLPILAKCGGSYGKYLNTWDKAYIEHVFSSTAILSYILFWMIFYNICHVF